MVRLARLGAVGQEVPVALVGDTYFDLRPLASDIDGAFFMAGGAGRVRDAIEQGSLQALRVDPSTRIGAPIARPGTVVGIGMNYLAHASESGSAPPTSPIIFLKPSNTVVGPFDEVVIPKLSTKTDWEVELGVVIGAAASNLASERDSMSRIGGFVTVNDVSERHFQLEISGGQWAKGKSAPGFTPTGPWLVTPDDFSSNDRALKSWVNGEPRQDGNTADLIFGVSHLVWYLSQFMSLEPGDLILTGTPAGVALSGRFPYLTAGDVCEVEIDGLGRQRQIFV